MNTLLTIFLFFLIISFLVFVHELGHFLAAKIVGVPVKQFAIGFGKDIIAKSYKGTKYSFKIFPLGGFVDLEGETKDISPNSFRNKSLPAKLFVLSAGVLMNIIFTTIFLGITLSFTNFTFALPKFNEFKFTHTDRVAEYFPVTILEVSEDSPFKNQINDKESIVGINGTRFKNFSEFYSLIEGSSGESSKFEFIDLETFDTYEKDINVDLKYLHGYFPIIISDVLENSASEGELFVGDKLIGFNNSYFVNLEDFFDKLDSIQNQNAIVNLIDDKGEISNREIFVEPATEDGSILQVNLRSYIYGLQLIYDSELGKPSYFINYKKDIISPFAMTYDLFRYQFDTLGNIFSNAFETGDYTEVSNSLGGLPTLGNEVNKVVDVEAFDFLIPLTALVSLSLASFNILPFPALDGGQMVVALIESTTRRKIPDEILGKINLAGFSVLILLSIAINVKDVIHLGWAESVVNIFQ